MQFRLSSYSQLSADWEISFDGIDCQYFVVAVNRYAYKNGKAKDDEWIAEFAGACFTGDALVWYVGLDAEIQDSWRQSRRALLAEYIPEWSSVKR